MWKRGDAGEILKFSSELNKGKRAGLAFYHYPKMSQIHRTMPLLSIGKTHQPKTIDW